MQALKVENAYRESWASFLKLAAMIAIPVALQNMLTTTGSMVDTLMLAKLDENVKGAVGLCAKYANLQSSGYWGFVGGGMLFMNQYWGAKDHKNLCRSFGMMFFFVMVVTLIFSGLAAFAPYSVMRILTDKEEYWSLGADYLRIVSIAYIFQALSVVYCSFLRSMEQVRIPLVASIVSLAVNIAANDVLIFGHLGFPALGIKGAAIGTALASFANIATMLVLAVIRKYKLIFSVKDQFRWNLSFIRLYLKKSFPILANEIVIGIGNFVIGIVLGRQIPAMINALALFNVFEGFVISFFSGFTISASVLVGKEVGAGNHETAFGRAKRLTLLTPIVVFVSCMVVLLLHKPILNLMGLTGEAYTLGRGMLTIFTVVATIRMTNWIQNDTFRSAGNPITGTVLEIVFMYLMIIPLTILSGIVWKWPPLLVFACCYVDEPFRLVLMLRQLLSGKWIRPVTETGLATLAAFRERHHIQWKPFTWRIKREKE